MVMDIITSERLLLSSISHPELAALGEPRFQRVSGTLALFQDSEINSE
jgi:hypothetical protein